MKKGVLIILILLSMHAVSQNTQPDHGHLFLQDEVARVDVLLPADSLLLMYEDVDYASEHEFEANFVYSTADTIDTIQSVGFRFRGNTSLDAEKKSFKISFNTFTDGGQFFGVEKMNLNGEHNDVSLRRSKLSWELLRNSCLPSSRTSYIELFINGIYAGLYLNVEHIDEEYVRKRYGQEVGNLYKCLWPATLQYLGSNPQDYKFEAGGRRVYDLKTHRYRDDYFGLMRFLQVLNTSSDEEFECRIETVFNVDDYLRIAAFDVLIGNWDGYIFNKNNFYLYENPYSGRMEYIPYDLDNTWGVDWLGMDWSQRDIYQWNGGNRPLYERLMSSMKFREQFSYYIEEWRDTFFNIDFITGRGQELEDLIAPYVLEDEFFHLDYDFSYEDFLQSMESSWGEHVDFGILEYVAARNNSVDQQLESFEGLHVIKEIRDSLMTIDSHLLRVWTEGSIDELSIVIDEDGVETTIPLLDDGLHMDGSADDGEWAIELTGYETDIDYQIVSTQGAEEVLEPCSGTYSLWFTPNEGPLYINEVMASNSATIADEAGEFEDWLEIYKASNSAVYLGEYFLTDDIHTPFKWSFPPEFISSDPFLLVWADKDDDQGLYHADFRLNAMGEELAIFKKQNASYRLMDHLIFPSVPMEESFGRNIDGGMPWVVFQDPTPDGSNGSATEILEFNREATRFFPNPVIDRLYFSGPDPQRIQIFDMLGKDVSASLTFYKDHIVTSGLSDGLFQIVVFDPQGNSTSSKMLKISE